MSTSKLTRLEANKFQKEDIEKETGRAINVSDDLIGFCLLTLILPCQVSLSLWYQYNICEELQINIVLIIGRSLSYIQQKYIQQKINAFLR